MAATSARRSWAARARGEGAVGGAGGGRAGDEEVVKEEAVRAAVRAAPVRGARGECDGRERALAHEAAARDDEQRALAATDARGDVEQALQLWGCARIEGAECRVHGCTHGPQCTSQQHVVCVRRRRVPVQCLQYQYVLRESLCWKN